MKYILHRDETIALDLSGIAANLNRIFHGVVSFETGKAPIKLSGSFVKNPESYDSLLQLNSIKTDASNADCVLILTKKPYDNNFFWDPPSKKLVIFSSFGWEYLTTLPMNNGLVFGVSFLISNEIGLGNAGRHDDVTGCINDFLWDKTGIDVCMRSAFVCASCTKKFEQRKLIGEAKQIYEALMQLLNDLSAASRANKDILSFWGFRVSETDFDVFLCHNSQDKTQIRLVSSQLKDQGIRPWLDEEQIQPGRSWQDVLEASIPTIKTAAVFVGKSGFGPWQNVEIKAILQEFVSRLCPVIPVMLADGTAAPQLPLFMRQFMWVDYRKTHPDPFKQLVWGITGQKI